MKPQNPPPDWDFSRIKDVVLDGARVFVVLLVYVLIPVTLALLGMIWSYLNGMEMIGLVCMVLTVLFYFGALFTVPAGIVIAEGTRTIGSALNPGKVMAMITKGGKPYLMLAAFSLVIGLPCLLVTLVAVFVGDFLPLGDFVVSGLLMAVVLSYAHFVWFHVLGRFSAENKKLITGS